MHVFIEIPSGSQPISHLLLEGNFRKCPPSVKFPENLQPYVYVCVLLELIYEEVITFVPPPNLD